MNKVVKWMMVVILVSIDILTPFGYSERLTIREDSEEFSQSLDISIENELEEMIEDSSLTDTEGQEDNQNDEDEIPTDSSDDILEFQEDSQNDEVEISEDSLLTDTEGQEDNQNDEDEIPTDSSDDILEFQEDSQNDETDIMEDMPKILGIKFGDLGFEMEGIRTVAATEVEGCLKYTKINGDTEIKIAGLADDADDSCKVNLEIPSEIEGLPVTEIGENTFRFKNLLEGNLVIPNTVTKIGGSAFYQAFTGNAENYLIFDGGGSQLEVIGSNAFYGNNFRGELRLPSGLSGVLNQFGGNLFTGIDFNGANITEIGERLFKVMKTLEGTLIIPSTVTKIGSEAFYQAFSGDTENYLVFEEGSQLNTMGNYAFYGNNIGGNLVLPSGLSGVLNQHFQGNLFTGIDFNGANITEIGNTAFKGMKTLEGTLTIPNTVTNIGYDAFNQAFNPDVRSSLVFEEGSPLTSLGARAFQNNNLNGVLKIPSNFTVLDTWFYGNAFTGIDLTEATNLTKIVNQAFGNWNTEKHTMQGTLFIPKTVTEIGNLAFYGAFSGDTENYLVFESNSQLTSIGTKAFYNDNFGGVLKIPSYLTELGNQFFGNPFTGIDLTEATSLITIGSEAFGSWSVQKHTMEGTLFIPKSVTSIGGLAFYGAFSGDTENYLVFETGSQLTTLGGQVFQYNNFIGTLRIPESLVELGSQFFKNKFTGTDLTQAQSLTTILGGAFYTYGQDPQETFEGTLFIPKSVTTIGASAFTRTFNPNTENYLVFESGSQLTSLGNGAFGSNYFTGEITIPEGLTSLGNDMFTNNRLNKVLFMSGASITVNAYGFCNNSGVVQGYKNGATVNVTSVNESCFHLNEKSQYTITFDTATGTTVESQIVDYYDIVEVPSPTPMMTGYVFKGWYLSGVDDEYDFSTSVTSSFTLYAKWEEIKEAYLLKGTDFKATLKSLANGNLANIMVITGADSLPDEGTITGLLSLSTSPVSVIAWYDDNDGTGTIYYYSDANVIYLHSDSSSMFSYFSNLQELDISSFNTSKVINMSNMFLRSAKIEALDLSNFNTSKVTNMSNMFNYCNALTSLNLSGWDTSKVTSMNSMFARTSLQELDLSNFDTSSVTNMSQMFQEDTKLAALDLSSFNTSKVTDMSSMFLKCSSLQELDLSNFDTSNVTNMSSMFNSISLTGLDLSNFDTSSVTDMNYMFWMSKKIESLDLSNFNTSKVTNMSNMFNYCNALTSLNLSGWDTSKVTSMNSMFARTSLQELDLSNFDTSSVTDMTQMFQEDTKLTILDLSNFDTSKVTNMSNMFMKCGSLQELDLSSFNTSKVTNMSNMFNSISLTGLDLSNFDTSSVTDMSYMFGTSRKIKTLDLSNFNTSRVTNMSNMFNYCNALTTLNLSGWDTSKVTSMNSMFARTSLQELDLSNFDTSSVTDMSQMFQEDTELTILDLSNFDTSKVTNMSSMFNTTSNLGIIYVSDKFSTGSLTSSNNMFINSKKIIGGNGTKWNSSFITGMYAQIDSESQSGYFTDPNNFSVRYLSGNEIVVIATGNKVGDKAPKITGDGKFYTYYSDLNKTIPYDFDQALSGYTEIYVDGIELKANIKVGSTFRNIIKGIANNNLANIYYFVRADGITDEIKTTATQIQTDDSETEIYVWFEPDTNSGTIFYYTDSKTIYLQGDVGMMFSDWTNLRELDLSNFDSNGVTSMSAMFRGSNKLEQLNLSNFNTSNLTSMYEMFKGCSSLRELDLSNFDTSNVTSFESTFYGCNSLTNLNISGFDTSKAINMFSMFNGCSKLTELDVSHFNTSKVTNMQNMFGGCSSLTGLHLSNFDTSKVTNMGGMFYNMGKLTSLDLSSFVTSGVTNMLSMFHGCSSLTGLNLSNFDTSKVTNMYEMFKGCSGLKDLNISNFNTANVTNMSYMFWRCNSLTELDLHSFVTTKVTNMSSMFNGASKLISLDVSNFDTSNTTNMGSMFGELHNITGIDLSNFDTSKVTDLGGMFYNMSNLEGLDLSNFDTKNVTSMADMFHGCSSLTGLDLSNFDTSKVTNMYEMFKGTTRLKTIYVGPNFTTGVASNTADMFRGTNALIGGNGTKWNSSFITGMYAQIDSESQSGYFTDPNNFTVRYLSGNEVVANLTGKVGGVATGLNDEGRIYSYYSDASKTIPYDFTTPLTGYTEIYVDWIYENEDVTIETNNSEYGMVNDGDITVEYGSTITTSGNELMIDGNTIIATPNVSNNQYTYGFNGWANTCGSETNPTYFDEIIYKYEGDYKFDGSNYINTNVSLFSDENYQRDFEISFDIVNYNTNTESQGSFISVMNETGNPYPGIVFRRSSKNVTTLELVSNGGVGTTIHEYNSSNIQNVKIFRKNSKLYLQINGGENTEVYDYTNFNSFFNVPLTIGASLDGNGNPWRYIKATLSNIEVKFTDGIGVTNGETVTGDCTITANFSRVKNSYPVTFKNYDGTILNEKTMEYGTTSQYVGDTPSKQGNVQYNYTFAGWDHQISQVIESQLYTATYTTELNQYTATIVSNNINSGTVNLGSVKADYNKSIVLSGNTVKIGETTVIATPKNSNEQYTYEFSGWNNMCGDVLTGDCTITAEFNSTVNKYLITFIDGDGNVIQSGMVEYGTIPVYLGNEPTKTKTAQYTYSFSGWDSELEEVTGQKTYTAKFTQTLNKYNIIFVDEDGETVLGSGMYVYGTQSGDIVRPIAQKPATAEYTYTFAGWTPEIREVTTGATYRATYSSTKNKYTIVWLDGDGNILKSEQIEYGKTPVYSGVVPTKTATQQYTYIFNNTWTPNIESVTTGAEYMAQFDSSINSYAVIINALPTGYGTVSSGSVVVNYGTTINVNSNVLLIGSETITATPIENDAQYTYIFSGWNNTCGNILQDNCTITAEFNRTVNEYIIKWEDGDGNIIWSGMYEYGVLPEYSGPTPTKVSTDEYNYTFNGQWLPSIHVVTGDAEYLAQFDGEIIRKESRNEQSGAGRRKKDISDIEIHLSAEENSSTGNVDVLDKPYKSEDDSYGSNTNISKDSSSQILGGQTEFEQAYNFAKLNGITTTPSIQKAKMNTNITRIQMAKMLSYYAINVLGKMPDTERGITKFNDVTNKMDKQYDNGVTLAYQLGIMGINMKNNSFRPNDEVTRAEFATALSRMLYDVEDGKGKIKYYEPHMAKLYNEGIITNTNPKLKEKRGYVMIMLMRSIKNTAK